MRVPKEIGDEQGAFTIGDPLGSGAMGSVYAGEGPRGERVAVKFLHPHLAAIPEIVQRFQREAKVACRIRSPHVAPVLLAGRTKGLWWIAYKRLDGETLAERLDRVRVLPPVVARPFVEHVLAGLAAAHDAHVIHRDIKPANIFLEREEASERASILDFGISKYTPPAGSTTSQQPLTSTSDVLGTTNYMAPEQAEAAAHVDPRADLFAAGVVAFQMITGLLPFPGGSPIDVFDARLRGQSRSLSDATGLPWRKRLEGFFRQALARAPSDRYPSAGAMLEAWMAATSTGGWPELEELKERAAKLGATARDDTVETLPNARDSGRAVNGGR